MYRVNELLTDEDVAELTQETFSAHKKARPWRRVAVLAACAALVVGLANVDALAAGLRQAWSYITGVGVVAGESEVWVQSGVAETTVGDYVYRVRDAYRQDGFVYLTVDVLVQNDPRENGGEYPWMTLGASLFCGAEKRLCQAWYDIPGESVQARFNASARLESAEDLIALGEQMGYGDMAARLGGAAAVGSYGMRFKDDGAPASDYSVSLWLHATEGETELYDRPPEATIALTLEPGATSTVETYTMDTPYGALSMLVSENGEKVQLLVERDAENPVRASYIAPLNLRFVDAEGNRYPGVPVQFNRGDMRQSEEIKIDGTPSAPITAIELPGCWVTLEDTTRPAVDATRYTGHRVENLDWTVSLK